MQSVFKSRFVGLFIRFMFRNTVVNPVPQEYVTKTTRYKNIYLFFAWRTKETKKTAWNILSCARDIQHTKPTTKRQSNRYTFILLFLVGFWTMHETRNTRKILNTRREEIWRKNIKEILEEKQKKNNTFLNTNSILQSSVVLARCVVLEAD